MKTNTTHRCAVCCQTAQSVGAADGRVKHQRFVGRDDGSREVVCAPEKQEHVSAHGHGVHKNDDKPVRKVAVRVERAQSIGQLIQMNKDVVVS